MKRAALPALALVGTLILLTSVDDTNRAWWFRGLVAVVGVLVARSYVTWLAALPPVARPEPFRPHRPSWRRRRTPPSSRRGSDRALHLASFSAGDAHRGLRPLLREIADERMRAHHGVTLDDPAAEALLAPATWELVRPDRPTPHDLRAPGIAPAAIDVLLADLEAL